MPSAMKKKEQKQFGPQEKPAVLLHQETGFRWVTYILGGIAVLLIGVIVYKYVRYKLKPGFKAGGSGVENVLPTTTNNLSSISEVSSDVLTNLSQL